MVISATHSSNIPVSIFQGLRVYLMCLNPISEFKLMEKLTRIFQNGQWQSGSDISTMTKGVTLDGIIYLHLKNFFEYTEVWHQFSRSALKISGSYTPIFCIWNHSFSKILHKPFLSIVFPQEIWSLTDSIGNIHNF